MSPADGRDFVLKHDPELTWLNTIERMGRRLSEYERMLKDSGIGVPNFDERPMQEIMVEKGQPDWGKPRKTA